jgi:hypothetical protein
VRTKLTIISLVAVGLLAISVPLFGHHGSAAYDTDKTITVKGTVTQWFWANPHSLLKVDTKDDSGNTVHWVIEGASTVAEAEAGWSKAMFKPGDEVAIDIMASKNFATHGTTVGRFRGNIVINGQAFKSKALTIN